MRIEIVPRQHARRPVVEAMVAEAFRREYGARLGRLPERMIAVIDRDGLPQCVAGLRDAATGFFSERYLDMPVEQTIALATGRAVARTEVLELGSVAALRPGRLLVLLHGFARAGLEDGYRWALFTTTERLLRLPRRLRIPLVDLGAASAERIDNPQEWGTYYAHGPRVCAVDMLAAAPLLARAKLPARAPARLKMSA
jgi:hypothetical protein